MATDHMAIWPLIREGTSRGSQGSSGGVQGEVGEEPGRAEYRDKVLQWSSPEWLFKDSTESVENFFLQDGQECS